MEWPDKTPAAGVTVVIYPRGFGTTDQVSVPQANVATGPGGMYATKICRKNPCEHIQAFLELPVNTVFPDGCTLPLIKSPDATTGVPSAAGKIDWTVSDGTCAADPSSKPINDPQLSAYTTEYVEQRINTLGGGTTATSTTTIPPA